MIFNVITLFPDMFSILKNEGVIARAIKKDIINIHTWQLRDFSTDGKVDDMPYGGGGAGMILKVQPIRACINHIKDLNKSNLHTIYLSPQGKKFNHQSALRLAKIKNIILLCGRYGGIDQRIIDVDIDEEISIGDFVLTGGELPAMMLIDSVSRFVSGVIKDTSTKDSFSDGKFDYPHYTKPFKIDTQVVPDILLSGNHSQIKQWRLQKAFDKTKLIRPDLLENE